MHLEYHWWTVYAWWGSNNRGLKVGPITVSRYYWGGHRWYWYVGVLCRPVWDGVCRPRLRLLKGKG